MNFTSNLLNTGSIKKISGIMSNVCYLLIFLLGTMLILGCLGRMQYHLYTPNNDYPRAIYAEDDHNFSSRSFTVAITPDSIRIHTNSTDEKVQLSSYIAILSLLILHIIPQIFSFWFLAKLFNNVSKGEIFIKNNALNLLYYGLIQIFIALVIPFIKILVVNIANTFIPDRISLSTGSTMFNTFIPALGFLVAAYIINYGVTLQDEVDHTI